MNPWAYMPWNNATQEYEKFAWNVNLGNPLEYGYQAVHRVQLINVANNRSLVVFFPIKSDPLMHYFNVRYGGSTGLGFGWPGEGNEYGLTITTNPENNGHQLRDYWINDNNVFRYRYGRIVVYSEETLSSSYWAREWVHVPQGHKDHLLEMESGVTISNLLASCESSPCRFTGAERSAWMSEYNGTCTYDPDTCPAGYFYIWNNGMKSFHFKDSYVIDANGTAWQERKDFSANGNVLVSSVASLIESGSVYYAPQRDESWLTLDPLSTCPSQRVNPYCANTRLASFRLGMGGDHSFRGLGFDPRDEGSGCRC